MTGEVTAQKMWVKWFAGHGLFGRVSTHLPDIGEVGRRSGNRATFAHTTALRFAITSHSAIIYAAIHKMLRSIPS